MSERMRNEDFEHLARVINRALRCAEELRLDPEPTDTWNCVNFIARTIDRFGGPWEGFHEACLAGTKQEVKS